MREHPANWSWPTLPMKPTLPPSEAMPAQVFAAEPPDVSTARPHPLVKRRGLLRRGQAHGALVERELMQQRLLARGDDVDERVADAGYLQGLIHEDRAFVAVARGAGVLGSNLQRLSMTQRQHSGFFALQT